MWSFDNSFLFMNGQTKLKLVMMYRFRTTSAPFLSPKANWVHSLRDGNYRGVITKKHKPGSNTYPPQKLMTAQYSFSDMSGQFLTKGHPGSDSKKISPEEQVVS